MYKALTSAWTCDFGDSIGTHKWIKNNYYKFEIYDILFPDEPDIEDSEKMIIKKCIISSETGTSNILLECVNPEVIMDLFGIDITIQEENEDIL